MKWLIASDIHGSAYWCKKLIQAFETEGASRMLILGDILYHGPRNDLPRDYNPKEVISLLNPLSDRILAVRGNCDAEVDQMVLDFPIMADYAIVPICMEGCNDNSNGDSCGRPTERIVYATHGHIYNANNMPKLRKGDILLHGHTHIPVFEDHDGIHIVNPGSVSIPKESNPNSYMVMETLPDNLSLTLKDFEGNTLAQNRI